MHVLVNRWLEAADTQTAPATSADVRASKQDKGPGKSRRRKTLSKVGKRSGEAAPKQMRLGKNKKRAVGARGERSRGWEPRELRVGKLDRDHMTRRAEVEREMEGEQMGQPSGEWKRRTGDERKEEEERERDKAEGLCGERSSCVRVQQE